MRRAAIEPVIGHMKNDGRPERCPLTGTEGDMLHSIMCGYGQNIRMILGWIEEAAERSKGEGVNASACRRCRPSPDL